MLKKSPNKSNISNSTKSKKSTNRDKDKKKLLHLGEASSSSSSSCMEKMQYSTTPENVEIYTGFGPETIQCVAEQFINETVSEEICNHLAEDISFRVREILQTASINMRQSKRKYLRVDDINATFKKFNIEPVYGPAEPNWITFGDPDNLSCVPDEPVDLYELTTSELSIKESGDIGVNYKWLNDTSLFNHLLINNSLNNYSYKIMNAAVSNKKSLRMLALKDVSRNVNIGPIIPHLCNFCFLILQKNITYSSLAAPILQFLEAIMFNPCTSYSIETNQITLLIYILLESIMDATNAQLHDVVPICRTLGRLCMNWIRGNQIVVEKINKYLLPDKPVKRLSAPVICALTYIGSEVLNTLLWPNIEAMFRCLTDMDTHEAVQIEAAILSAASLLYKEKNIDLKVNECLREKFADRLLPLWRYDTDLITKNNSDKTDKLVSSNDFAQSNWINLKMAFIKTMKIHSQQHISHRTSQFKILFKKAKPCVNRNINILVAGLKTLPIKQRNLLDTNNYYFGENKLEENVNIVTGRRTLYTLKKTFCITSNICNKNVQDMLYMI